VVNSNFLLLIKKTKTTMSKNKNLMTLEEFKGKNYGKSGTKERDELEAGYEAFKIGALIHDTLVEIGMTQEQQIKNKKA